LFAQTIDKAAGLIGEPDVAAATRDRANRVRNSLPISEYFARKAKLNAARDNDVRGMEGITLRGGIDQSIADLDAVNEYNPLLRAIMEAAQTPGSVIPEQFLGVDPSDADKAAVEAANVILGLTASKTVVKPVPLTAKQDAHISREMAKALERLWPSRVAGLVVKSAPERRYTLAMAYPANKPDAVKALDGHRDFASPEAVENAAWDYLRNGGKVGLQHEDGTDGAGKVVESYIHRGPDWPITAADGSKQMIKSGDWLIGIVWSDDAWDMVKRGAVKGVSAQGSVKRRAANRADINNLRGK
jgi:hypothetical protein